MFLQKSSYAFSILIDLSFIREDNEGDTSWNRVLVNTPYGGRLVVRLPAGTLLFVHLKDKLLVRRKKRWSQVCDENVLFGTACG